MDTGLAPLVRLELRRALPNVVRIGVATAVVLPLMVLAHRDAATLVAGAIGLAFGYAFIPPMLLLRDRLEGTLEGLRALPVDADVIARAKILAAGLLAIAGALQVGVMVAWVVSRGVMLPVVGPPSSGLVAQALLCGSGTCILGWCGLAGIAWVGMGLLARFEPEQVGWVPAILIGVATFVVPPLRQRVMPHPEHVLAMFVHEREAGVIGVATTGAAVLLVLAVVVVLTVSRAWIRTAVAHYDPTALRATRP